MIRQKSAPKQKASEPLALCAAPGDDNAGLRRAPRSLLLRPRREAARSCVRGARFRARRSDCADKASAARTACTRARARRSGSAAAAAPRRSVAAARATQGQAGAVVPRRGPGQEQRRPRRLRPQAPRPRAHPSPCSRTSSRRCTRRCATARPPKPAAAAAAKAMDRGCVKRTASGAHAAQCTRHAVVRDATRAHGANAGVRTHQRVVCSAAGWHRQCRHPAAAPRSLGARPEVAQGAQIPCLTPAAAAAAAGAGLGARSGAAAVALRNYASHVRCARRTDAAACWRAACSPARAGLRPTHNPRKRVRTAQTVA